MSQKYNSEYLPFGHHLIHFPPRTPLSSLLPDGTDPLPSPGPPFTRRMWAGGCISKVNPIFSGLSELGSDHCCLEYIEDVRTKGLEEQEKIFVTIERKIYSGKIPGPRQDPHSSLLTERRILVFMRDQPRELEFATAKLPKKILRCILTPDFSHTLIPTPTLLFRFSALTFNSHKIHLDKQYCREIEGHRNLLVHGPLSLIFMLEVLKTHLLQFNESRDDGQVEYIATIDYKNLAPLYAEEEIKVCLKRKDQSTFDVWIEGPDGGYAVKGVVHTAVDAARNKPVYEDEKKPGGEALAPKPAAEPIH